MNIKPIAGIAATLILFTSLYLSLGSCGKKNSTAYTGTVMIHLHTNIDTSEVADNTTFYSDADGRHFGLTTGQFFLSNIVLKNANGSTYTIKDAYVLKNIDSEAYMVGTAPVGTYTSVSFTVGLDAAANAKTPSAFSLIGYIPSSSMWYGDATKGYMFLKVEGFADTTASQNGTNPVHFSYEIGSAANLKSLSMPSRTGSLAPYTLLSGGIAYVHLVCDYGKLLSGVNFKTTDTTDTYTINPATATLIANNIPNMFSYEE